MRCGCNAVCTCAITAGTDNVSVDGNGSVGNPFRISVDSIALEVVDSPAVDLSLTGDGSVGDPYVLTASTDGTENGAYALVTLEEDSSAPASNGMIIKNLGGWGLDPGYGASQALIIMGDSDRTASYVGGQLAGVITAVTNTSPVKVTVAAHGASTGDVLGVRGTGVASIDGKWWKVTRVDANNVTLDGSVAGGTGTLTANSILFGDPNPVLLRMSAGGGIGLTGNLHVASGFRGIAGGGFANTPGGLGGGIWFQPYMDASPVIIFNADRAAWPATPVSAFVSVSDVHSVVSRELYAIEADGAHTFRRISGKADSGIILHLRNDADTADVFIVRADGGLTAKGNSSVGRLAVTSNNLLLLSPSDDAVTALSITKSSATQTAGMMGFSNETGTVTFGYFDKDGYYLNMKTTAPADAALSAGQLAMWFDKTSGAAKVMFKAKDNGGTVRTASVAMV